MPSNDQFAPEDDDGGWLVGPRVTAVTNHPIDVEKVDLRKRGDNLREDIRNAAFEPGGVAIQELNIPDRRLNDIRQSIREKKLGGGG